MGVDLGQICSGDPCPQLYLLRLDLHFKLVKADLNVDFVFSRSTLLCSALRASCAVSKRAYS